MSIPDTVERSSRLREVSLLTSIPNPIELPSSQSRSARLVPVALYHYLAENP